MDYKNKNLKLKEEKSLENQKFHMDINMQRSVSKPDLSFKSSVQNSKPQSISGLTRKNSDIQEHSFIEVVPDLPENFSKPKLLKKKDNPEKKSFDTNIKPYNNPRPAVVVERTVAFSASQQSIKQHEFRSLADTTLERV